MTCGRSSGLQTYPLQRAVDSCPRMDATKNVVEGADVMALVSFAQHCAALKHTTTISFLSDHDILSPEWRVIVHQVQTNYHGRPMVL